MEVADVVAGVPRGVGDLEAEHLLTAAQRPQVLLRDRRDLAPEPLHPVAVQALRARQQLRWVGQMTNASLVDVDRQIGPAPDHRAGSPGVVEMDVREENGSRLLVPHRLKHRLQRAARARVDQDPVDLPASDHPLPAEVPDVDQVHPVMIRAACAACAPAASTMATPSERITSAAARLPDWIAPSM